MPVKAGLEKTELKNMVDSATHDAPPLSKRVIQMPDGRYMIFYTDKGVKPEQEEKKT